MTTGLNRAQQPRRYVHTYLRGYIKKKSSGGSLGLVVMGRDSCSESCEFESWHRILDGHFLYIIVVQIVMMFAGKD